MLTSWAACCSFEKEAALTCIEVHVVPFQEIRHVDDDGSSNMQPDQLCLHYSYYKRQQFITSNPTTVPTNLSSLRKTRKKNDAKFDACICIQRIRIHR